MDSHLKFAAIDIGSNAIRLLLSGVFEKEYSQTFRKMSLIRMPVRLGDDAFTQKCISDNKVSQVVKSMIGFKHLIDAFQPLDFMACATSAMREAENGPKICKRILEKADIKVDIIDGKREAQIIFENKSADMFGGNDAYLYVDIGGGSTEITLFSQGRIITSGSFNIGTIRLLEGLVSINIKRLMPNRATKRYNKNSYTDQLVPIFHHSIVPLFQFFFYFFIFYHSIFNVGRSMFDVDFRYTKTRIRHNLY